MTKKEGICLALACSSFQTADQLLCDPSLQRSFKEAKQGCSVARGLSCGICGQTSLRLPSGTLGGLHQGCASCPNVSLGAAEAEVLYYYYFVFVNLFIWHVHTTLFTMFGWAGSWLLHAGFFSSCGHQGLLSSCRARASHCGGFSCGSA